MCPDLCVLIYIMCGADWPCKFPGCEKNRLKLEDGGIYGFCSREHKVEFGERDFINAMNRGRNLGLEFSLTGPQLPHRRPLYTSRGLKFQDNSISIVIMDNQAVFGYTIDASHIITV